MAPLIRLSALCLVLCFWSLWTHGLDRPADAQDLSDERPLLLGMVPVWSPSAQFTRMGLLRSHISDSLRRDVQLVSAPDVPEFHRRVARGYYDIVYTAPHFVSGALDSGFYRLAAVAAEPKTAMVVVRSGDAARGLASLAGRTVLTGPQEALVTVVGKRMLNRTQPTGQTRPRYQAMANMQAALDSLSAGHGDAAIVGSLMERDVEALGLSVVERSEPFPGVAILVSSALEDEDFERLQQLLVDLSTDSDGRRALGALGVAGFRKGRRAEYDSLRSARAGEEG
jgi:phosphonate transport system substrate-binding protein